MKFSICIAALLFSTLALSKSLGSPAGAHCVYDSVCASSCCRDNQCSQQAQDCSDFKIQRALLKVSLN